MLCLTKFSNGKYQNNHKRGLMEQIVNIEIAKDIVERLIAQECQNGVDESNPVLQNLILMKEEIYKNNKEIIDMVISQYKHAVNAGENNGTN